MIWQKRVLTKFQSLNMELRSQFADDAVLIVVPRLPDDKTQMKIAQIIPYTVQFFEGIKIKTLNQIHFLFNAAGVTVTNEPVKDFGRDINFEVEGTIEDEQALWEKISKELISDGFYETWSFTFEGRKISYNRGIMTALQTRKVSDGDGLDDMDLKIALEVSRDVNDFLAMLEGKKFTRKRKG